MTGFPLIIAFVIAIILMIVAISKFKIHPFISIMTVSLLLGLVAGIPLVNQTADDGTMKQTACLTDQKFLPASLFPFASKAAILFRKEPLTIT